MLKWFTKYQKIILVVGGSVLMVLFLLPSADFLTPDPAADAIGYIGDREITGHDHAGAGYELDLIARTRSRLAIHQQASARRDAIPAMGQLLLNSPLPDDAMHWLLALHDAKQNGVWSSLEEGRSMLIQFERAGIDLAPLLSVAPEGDYARALAHWQAYIQYADFVIGGGLINLPNTSEPRLRHLARDYGSRVTVEFVPIDPAKAIKDAPEPTEEQIKAHFEKYRNEKPGESEPYGFGYIVPDRVKLEYIAVPLESVADSIVVDEVDAIEYYETHPREFVPPPAPKPATPETPQPQAPDSETFPAPESTDEPDEADASPAEPDTPDCQETAVAPAPDADPNKPRPYREVRERIIAQLTDERARRKQTEIMKFIRSELDRSVNALPVDDNGYRKTEGFTPEPLDALARRVQERFGVLPEVVRMGDAWQSREDIREIEGFGGATVELSGRALGAAEYVFSVRELESDVSPQLEALRLQVAVPSRTVSEDDGAAYIFRVIAIAPEHEPANLDEVRDDVVKDLKELLAYEALIAKANELEATANEKGLEALAEAYESKVEKPEPFGRFDPFMLTYLRRLEPVRLPVVGASESFIGHVMDLARSSDGPVKSVAAIPVDEVRQVAVVKLLKFEPMDSEAYQANRPILVGFVSSGELDDAQDLDTDPLSFDAIRKRVGYRDRDGSQEETGASPAKTPSASETEG